MTKFIVFSYDKNFEHPICLGCFTCFKDEKQIITYVKNKFGKMPEYTNIVIKKENMKNNKNLY